MRQLWTILGTVVRRPWLLPGMLRASWAFRARNWYRRPPFLPIPPRDYLRWRLETAYGDADAVPPGDELARFLKWGERIRGRTKRS